MGAKIPRDSIVLVCMHIFAYCSVTISHIICIFHCLDFNCADMFIHAFISHWLYYFNSLLHGIPNPSSLYSCLCKWLDTKPQPYNHLILQQFPRLTYSLHDSGQNCLLCFKNNCMYLHQIYFMDFVSFSLPLLFWHQPTVCPIDTACQLL